MDKRVLIVDDSLLFAKLLAKIVDSTDGFTTLCDARDVYQATALIEKEKPDMIILDVEMQGMNGIQFLKKLIPQYAVPIIVCTSHSSLAKKALSAGAADFVVKPEGSGVFEKLTAAVTSALKNAANIREVNCGGVVYKLRRAADKKPYSGGLILIGGSAGSTEALPKLLKSFTPDMPPAAVTLHMPEGYTKIFAQRLDAELSISVCEAQNAAKLKKGTATIARGSKHLRVYSGDSGFYASVGGSDKISGHCPSVDALFLSAAELDTKKMIAVLLTGMGSDGAKGLLKLRQAGAYTIGQDEESSLVYGMPKAAYEMGAVCEQCALEDIAARIKKKTEEW